MISPGFSFARSIIFLLYYPIHSASREIGVGCYCADDSMHPPTIKVLECLAITSPFLSSPMFINFYHQKCSASSMCRTHGYHSADSVHPPLEVLAVVHIYHAPRFKYHFRSTLYSIIVASIAGHICPLPWTLPLRLVLDG